MGKILGPERMTKSGLGTASERLGDCTIGVLFAVNAFGDVVDPETGTVIAGPRDVEAGGFLSTIDIMRRLKEVSTAVPANTVIGVVATDATLSKEQATKVAQMAHSGLARAIRPAHTMFDGDVVFTLATGRGEAEDVTLVGSVAAELTATAIVRAAREAEGLCGVPAARDVT